MNISSVSTLITHQVPGSQVRAAPPPPDEGNKKPLNADAPSHAATSLDADGGGGLLAEIQAMINAGETHNDIMSFVEAEMNEHGAGERKGFLFDGRL